MQKSPIRIVIADDEAPARMRLIALLNDIHDSDFEVVAEAKNGEEALMLVAQNQADILFLDIKMPTMNGLEAAEHLQKIDKPPTIIFTTAFDEYAVKAFDINAIDYLLKPIRQERLATALNKAKALMPAQIQAIQPLKTQRSHFSISMQGRIILVPISEVIYFRADHKYTVLRTQNKEYLIEDSLTSLAQDLEEDFLRLNRNCLVAKMHIAGIKKNKAEDSDWVVMLHHISETPPISRRQLSGLKRHLENHQTLR